MAEGFNTAMANRSLRTIRSELEFLLDANVITDQQFQTVINTLPSANGSRTPLPAATPVPATHEVPVAPMANMHIQNDEKRQQPNVGYYANNPTPPPPAYASAPPAPTALATASALYQYNAQDDGDLALLPNDRVLVTEYMNAEWWKGKNERTGQEGIFPRSYVKVVDEKGPMVPGATPQPSNYGNMPLDVSNGVGGGQPGKEPSKANEQGKKFGKKLGNAAIFGAGATIGSNIVNGIF